MLDQHPYVKLLSDAVEEQRTRLAGLPPHLRKLHKQQMRAIRDQREAQERRASRRQDNTTGRST